MKKLLFFILACSISSLALACAISQVELNREMQKAKHLKLRPNILLTDNNLTEVEFNGTVNRIRDHFTPIFLAQGRTLNVYSSWDFPMNNAFATRDNLGSNVYFFGLFTMNKYMTKDSFLFVTCHEIGHHLGGFPKEPGSRSWSSVEGEADYYAASKCYREILKGDPLNAEAEKLNLPESVKAQCKTQFADDDAYHVCLRAARAGEDVAKMLDYMATSKETTDIFLLRPEPVPVLTTQLVHPAPVCRTHTILQASLCGRPSDVDISDTDETIGACHEKNGDTVGNRALCWFKPANDVGNSIVLK